MYQVIKIVRSGEEVGQLNIHLLQEDLLYIWIIVIHYIMVYDSKNK